MIKQTFYNLSEEKRERIINAIKKEFASLPSEKVSINSIVKEAQISRGSFYQYFDDKVDLVEIVIKEVMDGVSSIFLQSLEENERDIFAALSELFDRLVISVTESDKKDLIINVITSVKTNDSLFSEYMKTRMKGPKHEPFVNIVDNCMFKNQDEAYMEVVMEMLMQILVTSFFDVFALHKDVAKVRLKYLRKIDIVKYGVMKTNSNLVYNY